MNRRKRTEILIKGNKQLSADIADEIIKKYEVKNVEEPNNGLVMIKMRDTAKKELFYLGEVLVTESKVYVNGALGVGIIAADDEETAYNLAVIDGAYKAGVSEIEKWDKLLEAEDELNMKREMKLSEKILETKVDFSTMNV